MSFFEGFLRPKTASLAQAYSQNDEDSYIVEYFEHFFRKGVQGTFLDIGAFHPTKFSNTRALYERGFKGVFVEPSPSLAPAFEAEYGNDPDVQILQVCVGNQPGEVDFYDSGGDAISTTVASETKRWEEEFGSQFKKITRDMVTIDGLVALSNVKQFDFVNVDTEGNVLEILEQIDVAALGVKLLCVEWNGQNMDRFETYFASQGLKPIAKNHENLIYGKPKGLWTRFA